MDDAQAYMALVLSNTQSELSPIERGLHALKSGMSLRAYAEATGRSYQTVQNEAAAAEVFANCNEWLHVRPFDTISHKTLVEIHPASRWLWPALVERAAAEEWTVAGTRKAVATLNSGMAIKAYAEMVGRSRQTVQDEVAAAEVFRHSKEVPDIRHIDTLSPQILTAIHAAPRWLWPALVERAAAEEWTVAGTRKAVAALNSGMSLRAYAEATGRPQRTIANEAQAAEVFREANGRAHVGTADAIPYLTLVEIHAAPRWLFVRALGLPRDAYFAATGHRAVALVVRIKPADADRAVGRSR